MSPYVFNGNTSINAYDEDGAIAWAVIAASTLWNAALSAMIEVSQGGEYLSWDGAGKGAILGAFQGAAAPHAAIANMLSYPITSHLPSVQIGEWSVSPSFMFHPEGVMFGPSLNYNGKNGDFGFSALRGNAFVTGKFGWEP